MVTSKNAEPAAPAVKNPVAVLSSADATEQLRLLKLNLQATREKLMLVSPDLLSDADHEAWSNQIFQVSMAINGVRNVALQTLSDAFKAELPAFAAATTQLTEDLFRLQQAVDVIKAVAGALGVISQVASLLG